MTSNIRAFHLILPVLFYEYLAIALTKALIPTMIIEWFGDWTYMVIGMMETLKGIAAFIACPFFGKLSDTLGRKPCLIMSITGTTLPVVMLAFVQNMNLFCVMVAISGFFAATFPLTFAYISDCIPQKDRAPAYGLALATFGLSFSIGPFTGGYIAATYGRTFVFLLCFFLVILDLCYVVLYLPETAPNVIASSSSSSSSSSKSSISRPSPREGDDAEDDDAAITKGYLAYFMGSIGSIRAAPGRMRSDVQEALSMLPDSWNPIDTFNVFQRDAFMSNIALVVFMYYMSVWGMVSTLMVYVTRALNFSPQLVGWLLSTYGISTMFSEAVLVRIVVPAIGEVASMRVALVAFAIQAVIIAFSKTSTGIFVSVFFSMITNLFYPAISALVSRTVAEDEQGEALGALNGIKAATEGLGPLLFGALMSLYEGTAFPGAPYLITGLITLWALLHSWMLPKDGDLVTAKHKAQAQGDEEASGLLSDSSVAIGLGDKAGSLPLQPSKRFT